MDKLYADMEKRVGIDRVEGSLVHYKQARTTLGKFVEAKFKTKDVAFGQLTNQFISDYYEFLVTYCDFMSNSTRKYLAILKKACRLAYKEGYADRFFFANYTLPKMQVGTPRTITPENFKKIQSLEIPLPEAIDLIEKYKDESRAALMPYQKYKTLWDNLRKICKMAGTTQMVSPHMGRHYYASIVTSAENVPIDVISKMLGHTNITQTQVYARVTQKKLLEEAAKFAEATKDLVLVL